jgi:hypothetical protein
MPSKFVRLVRFKNPNGHIFYGELGLEIEASRDKLIGTRVKVYGGEVPWDEGFKITTTEEEISEVGLLPNSRDASSELS